MSFEYSPEFSGVERRAHPYPETRLPYNQENLNELTGLPNRTALGEMLSHAVETMPGNFGVVAMDLDGLKAVNDEEGGHKAGDQYIKYAAGILHDIIRSGDAVPVHLSGDEFVGVIAGVSAQWQLDSLIGRTQTIMDDHGVPISMGGRIHKPGETPEQMMNKADALAYRNKLIRKFHAHTPEQRQFALRVTDEAIEMGVKVRDIPAIVASVALMAEMQEGEDQED